MSLRSDIRWNFDNSFFVLSFMSTLFSLNQYSLKTNDDSLKLIMIWNIHNYVNAISYFANSLIAHELNTAFDKL